MIRKLAAVAVVALVPGFAFAATAATPVPPDSTTHAVGGEVKTDTLMKADNSAKTEKAVVHKKVVHKTKGGKAKAGAEGKIDSSKL
jgi:hypothetical protein